jgi:hypothetical protein
VLSTDKGSAFELPCEKESSHKVGEAKRSMTTPMSQANLKDLNILTPYDDSERVLILRSFWMGTIEFHDKSGS